MNAKGERQRMRIARVKIVIVTPFNLFCEVGDKIFFIFFSSGAVVTSVIYPVFGSAKKDKGNQQNYEEQEPCQSRPI